MLQRFQGKQQVKLVLVANPLFEIANIAYFLESCLLSISIK